MLDFDAYLEITEAIKELENEALISEEYSEQTKQEKEFSEWESRMNRHSDNLGNVGSLVIIKSGHLETPRYPDSLKGKMTFAKVAEEGYPLRGDNISDANIKMAIKKAIDKEGEGVFKKHAKVMVVYKNKKGRWDMLSARMQGHEIHVITAIQGKRFSPSYNPQQGQYKIIVEGVEYIIIEVELD